MPWPDPDDDGARPDIPPWPASAPEVIEIDNPVTATLYGPDGTVLVEVRQRPTVPFGYR